ncbi:hypothetical protein C8R45DRAFT_923408 [Mycena sanguinolenta]|nr:hypothetical protein C8R45DRAFT_923408 [Mycena sanguinolenta]
MIMLDPKRNTGFQAIHCVPPISRPTFENLGLPRSTTDFSWSTLVHVGLPHKCSERAGIEMYHTKITLNADVIVLHVLNQPIKVISDQSNASIILVLVKPDVSTSAYLSLYWCTLVYLGRGLSTSVYLVMFRARPRPASRAEPGPGLNKPGRARHRALAGPGLGLEECQARNARQARAWIYIFNYSKGGRKLQKKINKTT